VLEVETRNMKGPRDFDVDGLPMHEDNETIIKERIYLDKANPDLLHDEITTIDDAPRTRLDLRLVAPAPTFWPPSVRIRKRRPVIV
jgi:hypothetical protein